MRDEVELGTRDSHLAEIARLHQEVELLRQHNYDLQIALATTTEHGDIIEAELYESNARLQVELVERQRAERALKALLNILVQEKTDLEIIFQTVIEHGDVVDTQWQQKLKEAKLLAASDGLTQVANRRRFDEYLAQQWQQMSHEQSMLAIILCDIDCFKQYNDAYGHLAGDDCLRRVAQTLSSTLKYSSDLLARYGGEEFVAIVPHATEIGALRLAERMQKAIAELQIPHSQSSIHAHITLSIGVACTIPQWERSPNSLIDHADQLLYRAKQGGKNRIVHGCLV